MPPRLPTPHPEWERLVELRNAIRSQIAATICERHALDDSRSVVLGEYAAAFGDRLQRLSTLEIETSRLKREIDLVQAALNGGHEVDYVAIQETLEEEFAEWQKKLEAQARELASQKTVLDNLLDPATNSKLRELYRVLVRRLHPDLHPGQAPAHAELWHRVTAAKENQDLDELSALELLTRDFSGDDDPKPERDSMEVFGSAVEALRLQHERLLLKLADLRKGWPFDQIPLLEDSGATLAKQEELDQRIALAESLRDERRKWLNQLLDH